MWRFLFISLLFVFSLKTQAQQPSSVATNAKDTAKHEIKDSLYVKRLDMSSILYGLSDYAKYRVDSNKVELYHPVLLRNIFFRDNGNIGLPAYSLEFQPDTSLNLGYIKNGIFQNANIADTRYFYNSFSPATEVLFENGSKKHYYFHIFHTRRLAKNLNYGFKYNVWGGEGSMFKQFVNNRNFRLFASYTPKRYGLFVDYSYNKLLSTENGGMTNEQDFLDGNQSSSEFYPVNLRIAKTIARGSELIAMQYFNFLEKKDSTASDTLGKRSVRLYHQFKFFNNRVCYTSSDNDSVFYDNAYYSSSMTDDSSRYKSMLNEVGLQTVGYFLHPKMNMSLYVQSEDVDIVHRLDTGNMIGFKSSYRRVGSRISYGGEHLKMFLTGENSLGDNDLMLNFKPLWFLTKKIYAGATLSFVQKSTESFYNHYYSNHFKWDNVFNATTTKLVGMQASAYGNSVKVDYMQLNNYMYFDTLGMPSQYKDVVDVMRVRFDGQQKLWRFLFRESLLLQQTSNSDIVRVPMYSGVLGVDYCFRLFKKVMQVRVGTDVWYNSAYYANKYMPANGVYYQQNIRKVGDYPRVDLHASFRFKRAQIFVVLEHANAGFSGNDYFNMPGYPMSGRILRYGVSWVMLN